MGKHQHRRPHDSAQRHRSQSCELRRAHARGEPIAESLSSADAIIDAATITATGGVAHADYLEQSLEIWE